MSMETLVRTDLGVEDDGGPVPEALWTVAGSAYAGPVMHTRVARRARATLMAVAAAVVLLAAACGSSQHRSAASESELAQPASAAPSPTTPATTTAAPVATTTPVTAPATTAPAPTTAPPAPVGAEPPLVVPAGSVTAIGDSVMIDAEPNLLATIPGIVVDAVVSRQVTTGITDIQARAASGGLGNVVVFGLGTNGTFSLAAFQQLVAATAGRTLVVITSHCPYCRWTPTNNAMIYANCTPANHCRVADFEAVADRNPSWFGGDGVHLPIGGTGSQAYAETVRAALA